MPNAEQQTYFNLRVTNPDSTVSDREYVSETQAAKIKAEAAKVNATVEELKAQTFTITTASTIQEILEVTPNEEVALSYYNYGLTLAQHNVKRDLMTSAEWAPVEGSYDLIADVQQPKDKRVADPLSASRRSLRALWSKFHPGEDAPTDEQINAVLAQFAAAGQAVGA